MDAAKRARTQCLKNFTHSQKTFDDVHAKELPLDVLTGAFEKVQSCFDKLETAQDAFVAVNEGTKMIISMNQENVTNGF